MAYFIAGAEPVKRSPEDPLAESAIRDVYRLFQDAQTELTEDLICCGTRAFPDEILNLAWYDDDDGPNLYLRFFGNDVCSAEWWTPDGRYKWEDLAISVDNLKDLGLPDRRSPPPHLRRLDGSTPA